MSTLTERYIFAVTRNLSAETARDVRAELAASIDDALEARMEAGEPAAEAERAVLTELGDPGALAAGYTDHSLVLIGPRHYLVWRRLLLLLLAIVPAAAALGVGIGVVVDGGSVGVVAAEAITVAISAAVYVSFGTTLVFAILERTGARASMTWDLDQLPELPSQTSVRTESIGSLVFLGVFALVLLGDRFPTFIHYEGSAISILNPALWPWQIGAVLLLLAAEAAMVLAVLRRGAWTQSLAVLNTAIAVLGLSLAVTLLGRGELFNPEFVAAVFTDNGVTADTLRVLGALVGFGILGIAATDIAGGWLRLAKANRR